MPEAIQRTRFLLHLRQDLSNIAGDLSRNVKVSYRVTFSMVMKVKFISKLNSKGVISMVRAARRAI